MLKCGYKKLNLVWMFSALFVIVVSRAHAQDLEPRAYSNAPVGLNFLLTGYAYSQGGVVSDPAVPLEDADIEVHKLILAYVHTFDLWGLSSKFNVVAPYACASGSAKFAGEPKERNVCGFGDPRFRLTVNFYGAPALSMKEFKGYKQDTISRNKDLGLNQNKIMKLFKNNGMNSIIHYAAYASKNVRVCPNF